MQQFSHYFVYFQRTDKKDRISVDLTYPTFPCIKDHIDRFLKETLLKILQAKSYQKKKYLKLM